LILRGYAATDAYEDVADVEIRDTLDEGVIQQARRYAQESAMRLACYAMARAICYYAMLLRYIMPAIPHWPLIIMPLLPDEDTLSPRYAALRQPCRRAPQYIAGDAAHTPRCQRAADAAITTTSLRCPRFATPDDTPRDTPPLLSC